MKAVIAQLGNEARQTVTWRSGTKGALEADFASVRVCVADGDKTTDGTPGGPHCGYCEVAGRPLSHSDGVTASMNDRDERLKQFFGAYFHQDWMLDAPDPQSVVQEYIDDRFTASELVALADALQWLNSEYETSEALADALVRRYGSFFDPRGGDQDAKAWIESIVGQLVSGTRAL